MKSDENLIPESIPAWNLNNSHCIVILSFQIHLSKRHGSRAERDSALPRGVPALGTDSRHQVEEGERQTEQVQLQHAQGLPLRASQPAQQVHVEGQCRQEGLSSHQGGSVSPAL